MGLSSVHYFVNDEKGLEDLLIWWVKVCPTGTSSPFYVKVPFYKDDNFDIVLGRDGGTEILLRTGDRVEYVGDGEFMVIPRSD